MSGQDGPGKAEVSSNAIQLNTWPNQKDRRINRERRGGQNLREDDSMLPFLSWRVSIGRRRSPQSGAVEVSRGEPGVIPGYARGDPGVYFRPIKLLTREDHNGLTQVVPDIAANKARFKRIGRPSMATSTTSE
jgi:hypothetical protein